MLLDMLCLLSVVVCPTCHKVVIALGTFLFGSYSWRLSPIVNTISKYNGLQFDDFDLF